MTPQPMAFRTPGAAATENNASAPRMLMLRWCAAALACGALLALLVLALPAQAMRIKEVKYIFCFFL